MIGYIVFSRCGLYNRCYFPIVHMADIGKQVVLHLVVQPPDHPGEHPALLGVVAGGGQLVEHALAFDRPVLIRLGKIHIRHDMGRLENEGNAQSRDKMQHKEGKQDLSHSKGRKCDRQSQREYVVHDFPSQDLDHGVSVDVFPLHQAHAVVAVKPDEILGGNPGDRGQSVEKPGVPVLVGMQDVSFRIGRKSQEERCVDVIIPFRNVGVGMVQYIVLDPPNGRIGPHHVQGIAQKLVDEGSFGVRAMDGVVHHTHADACHAKSAEDEAGKQLPGLINHSGNHQQHRREINGHHDNSLDDHLSVGKLGLSGGFEVGIDPTF